MLYDADVIIIGGGLAGLTAAIHLSGQGWTVILIEKDSYPHHKVCGEYVSNEVLPYLRWLDADPFVLSPVKIDRAECSAENGKAVSCTLPLGGFGLSRYVFDAFLYEKALKNGCTVLKDEVMNITDEGAYRSLLLKGGGFLKSVLVMGAFGKRSVLDTRLSRPFISHKSPWLAIKGHYRGQHPENIVALHNFRGGYCGVSRIEGNKVNICYLVQYDSFLKFKDIEMHRKEVLCQNPRLREIFANAEPLFERPLTISQISFDHKETAIQHLMMIGDTAGLIHPLCGNGMAMAIHSARIASELAIDYLNNKGDVSLPAMENAYQLRWQKAFGRRIKAGRYLSFLMQHRQLSVMMMHLLTGIPSLFPLVIKQTHGKPLTESA